MKKSIVSFLLAIVIMLTVFPFGAFAEEPNLIYLDISKGSIKISNGSVWGHTLDGETLTKYDSGAIYVVTGTTDKKTITVNGGAVTLLFDNCNIDLSGTDNACAVTVQNKSQLSLGIMSDSTIKSGKNCAGIQVTTTSSLDIIEPAAGNGGILNVYGGDNASAIGANANLHSGKIRIKYGTVNLYGGNNSAALGRSNGKSICQLVFINGNNTTVNTYGKLSATEATSITVNSGATLNCESGLDSNAIHADTVTINDACVNSKAPGNGIAISGKSVSITNSVVNAESAGNTAINKATAIQNSSVTVKSPDSVFAITASSNTITNSEIFVLGGQMSAFPESFIYKDKVCTYTPKNPITKSYTIPDGHTVIIPEGTTVDVAEGGGLHEGNGTLIVNGKLFYHNTFDGTENSGPILDNFALIEDGKVTWFSEIKNAVNRIKESDAQNITLRFFESVNSFRDIPEKEFTIDLYGNSLDISVIPEKSRLSIINTSSTTSTIISTRAEYNNRELVNYGTLVIQGKIDLRCIFKNSGGDATLIDITSFESTAVRNCDGGTLTLDGVSLRGDSAGGYNEEGCILNIINGGSISSEGSAFVNYGTINADDFYFYGYNSGLEDEGGKVTLKNGTIYATYGATLTSNGGELYIENCEISAYQRGSGISSNGILHIKDSTVISSQFGLTGIGHSGTLTVENCIIDGGYDGLCLYEGTAKITDSSMSGGFYSYNGYGLSNGGEMTVENCDIIGGYGVGNSGTISLKGTDINNLQWGYSESYAIFNSGDFYFEDGLINGDLAAYMDEGGTATIKNATIEGFDFSWDYDPIDLYGNEATFNMNGGTVKLYESTLPHGFYVVTNEECETEYTIKDLIADDYILYDAKDDSAVELDDSTTMLDGSYYIKSLPDFGVSIVNIDENNVTSDDVDIISAELSVASEYAPEDYSEEIATKIIQTKEKCNALLNVIVSVKEKAENINSFSNELNANKATTDAIDEIEAVAAQASNLLSGNNLTSNERSDIEASKAKLDSVIVELTERKKAIDKVLEKSDRFTSTKPTTDNEKAINELIAEIDALLALELTEEQLSKLKEAKNYVLSVLDSFEEERIKLTKLQAEFEQIDRTRVNIFDKKHLENLCGRIGLLISQGTFGGDDLEEAKKLESRVQTLIELVQTPSFYGIVRIFWTIISMINVITP